MLDSSSPFPYSQCTHPHTILQREPFMESFSLLFLCFFGIEGLINIVTVNEKCNVYDMRYKYEFETSHNPCEQDCDPNGSTYTHWTFKASVLTLNAPWSIHTGKTDHHLNSTKPKRKNVYWFTKISIRRFPHAWSLVIKST